MNNTSIKESYSDQLVKYVVDNEFNLFKDQLGEPCIASPEAPFIAKRIATKEVKVLLRKIIWDKLHKSVQEHVIDDAINTLSGLAMYSEVSRNTYTRVAEVNGTIYYDIGDNKNIVKITQDGWEITNNAPVLFRRYTHQVIQVLPKTGGQLNILCNFIHVNSEIHKILLLTYLPVCLMSNIDRPLLLIHGPQGAGKSTALEFIRDLIDPSKLPLLQPPKNETEMVQQANKNYAYFLDNLSFIRQDISDTFCRFVTGSAFSKRALYTDDDDYLYEFKRVTGFTSIAQIANSSDLLERSLIIQLDLLNQSTRIPEEQLNKDFLDKKSLLLGSLFDATSGMLRLVNEMPRNGLPRMADYYRYAMAASVYLQFGVVDYKNAFATNIKHQNQETIESSPIIQCILIFMKNKTEYLGTSTSLYLNLKDIAIAFDMSYGFPKGAAWLWRKIQQFKATFDSIGILTERKRDMDSRYICIKKTEKYNKLLDDSIPDVSEAQRTVFLEPNIQVSM